MFSSHVFSTLAKSSIYFQPQLAMRLIDLIDFGFLWIRLIMTLAIKEKFNNWDRLVGVVWVHTYHSLYQLIENWRGVLLTRCIAFHLQSVFDTFVNFRCLQIWVDWSSLNNTPNLFADNGMFQLLIVNIYANRPL